MEQHKSQDARGEMMVFLDLKQAIGLTETKLMVFDKLIDLSKKLDGKITTAQLVQLKKGLIEMATKEELKLLHDKLETVSDGEK